MQKKGSPRRAAKNLCHPVWGITGWRLNKLFVGIKCQEFHCVDCFFGICKTLSYVVR